MPEVGLTLLNRIDSVICVLSDLNPRDGFQTFGCHHGRSKDGSLIEV
jgi:hypothetical protein